MMKILKRFKSVFQHAGSGRNVNMYSLARNALPAFLVPNGGARSPLTIFLSVNSICNLKCKMCDVGQGNQESSFFKNLQPEDKGVVLDFERLTRMVDEAKMFPIKPRFSVTTTEPFLYKDLFALCRRVVDGGMEFTVTTNGALMKNRVDDILASGMTELVVSIDAKGSQHDEIRGMPGLYDNIVEVLRQIKERKEKENRLFPKIMIATAITNHNDRHISELPDDLDEALYDRMVMTHMNFINQDMVDAHNRCFSHVYKAETAGLPGGTDPAAVDVPALYEQIQYIKSKHPKVYFAPDYTLKDLGVYYREPSAFVWKNRCFIPYFVIEILANGDVIPLTRCLHIKMGNIYEHSIMEIWNNEKYRTFRQHLIKHKRFPVCARCRGIL